MNTLDKLFAGFVCVITPAVTLNPPVFTVGIDNDAHLGEGGRVCGRVWRDGADGTGGRGMNRQHSSPAAGQRLTTQYAIAGPHAEFTLSADMLF